MIDKAKLLEAIERYAAARIEVSNNPAALSLNEFIPIRDDAFDEFNRAAVHLGAALAAVNEPLLDSTVEKAARVLSDRAAVVNGWNKQAIWDICKQKFIADARAMLEAIQ